MASLVARALLEEETLASKPSQDARRGIDRVLLAAFWRPSLRTTPGEVVPLDTASGQRLTHR